MAEYKSIKGSDTVEPVKYFQVLTETLEKLDLKIIYKLVKMIRDAKRVYVFGNGGSAATASHFAVDLAKGCDVEAICLNDNVSVLTAYGNDVNYESIFSFQLCNLIYANDLVIAFSCSGNSKNIIEAIRKVKSFNIKTIAITGFDGGKAGEIADLHVNVPVNDMQIAEDIHLIITHLIYKLL